MIKDSQYYLLQVMQPLQIQVTNSCQTDPEVSFFAIAQNLVAQRLRFFAIAQNDTDYAQDDTA